MQQTIEKGKDRYDLAKRFLAGEEQVLTEVGRPYVLESPLSLKQFRHDFVVKGVVLVVAGVFLAIFLAFIVNFFEQIRSDEESMEKIRQALKKK